MAERCDLRTPKRICLTTWTPQQVSNIVQGTNDGGDDLSHGEILWTHEESDFECDTKKQQSSTTRDKWWTTSAIYLSKVAASLLMLLTAALATRCWKVLPMAMGLMSPSFLICRWKHQRKGAWWAVESYQRDTGWQIWLVLSESSWQPNPEQS